MTGYLQKLADFSVLAFVVSSMLAMGMSQRLEDVIAPLKKPGPVVRALLVNFVLAPLLSVALSRLIPLQPAHAVGLLLLGGAAGAPFLPKLAEFSGGSLAYSVALMMLLMVGTIVFMPLALPFIVPGVKADPLDIAKPLLILMLLPLGFGFALARRNRRWLAGLLAFVKKVSNLAFVLLLVLMVGLNLKTMAATLGSFAIGTYALFVVMLVATGYLLSGPDKSTRDVFALGAGNRNISAALVVATAGFDDPAITVMLLIAAVVGLVVLLLLAKAMRRRARGAPAN
jgi:BASS family bile acid:Na+ symporter